MKQKLSEQELMGQAPIGTAVAQMAIPSIISQLVTIVYNMADTFFVGQTGDSLQVAAVSLTNPCFIFMMAVANVLGMGGSALLSASLGAKNEERARRTSAFVLYGSIIAGVIIAAVLLIFQNPILRLFGADKTTIGFARSYVRWIAVGAPFIIWSAAASFVVRSAGASKEAMIGNMIGTIANIILDPIFISVWHKGAGGAAIATTLGNIMASVYYTW